MTSDQKAALMKQVHKQVHDNIAKAAGALQRQRGKTAPWPLLEPLSAVDIADRYGEYTMRGIIAVSFSNHRYIVHAISLF